MPNNGAIPFLDLSTLHQQLEGELVPVFQQTLRTAGFVGGPMVEEFEREFAKFCNAGHCVGLASGTDAVRFALMAAGVKPGDIVVTVPNTFIATTEAISQAGARPDFVDVDERTYCMDAKRLQEYLERECSIDNGSGKLIHLRFKAPVTAVVPVHLYGQMCDMDAILELAGKYGLIVIEDACQAHGAEYFSKKEGKWKKAGTMGQAAAFSFYPGKNLGACGEAGAVTTNDERIARVIRMLRDHGQAKKYYHDMEGYNGRLDALQAGFLTVKLRHLADWNHKRRAAARRYDELLSSIPGVVRTHCPEWSRPVYHLYVIRVQNRDALQKNLERSKIGTAIHYPVPLHLQEAYKHLGYAQGSFPVSESAAAEILSLPMYPQLGVEEVRRVVQELSALLLTHPMSAGRAASQLPSTVSAS